MKSVAAGLERLPERIDFGESRIQIAENAQGGDRIRKTQIALLNGLFDRCNGPGLVASVAAFARVQIGAPGGQCGRLAGIGVCFRSIQQGSRLLRRVRRSLPGTAAPGQSPAGRLDAEGLVGRRPGGAELARVIHCVGGSGVGAGVQGVAGQTP